jgi:hypothetical protein
MQELVTAARRKQILDAAWHPPVALLPTEQTVITRIKRAKWLVFLGDHRRQREIAFDNLSKKARGI